MNSDSRFMNIEYNHLIFNCLRNSLAEELNDKTETNELDQEFRTLTAIAWAHRK